jgi:hypothetical protein
MEPVYSVSVESKILVAWGKYLKQATYQFSDSEM